MKKSIFFVVLVSVLSFKSIAQNSSDNQNTYVALNTSTAPSVITNSLAESEGNCENVLQENMKANYAFDAQLVLNKYLRTVKLIINSPAEGYAIVNVTDMLGRKVMSTKTNVAMGSNNKEFEMMDYARGLYNVQVITNKRTTSRTV